MVVGLLNAIGLEADELVPMSWCRWLDEGL
jgi:hypothetical protein